MTDVFTPAKSDSRSGQILWLVGMLVAFIIVAYLAAMIYLTISTKQLAVIPWFDISSIVGTLLISGGLPYGVNRVTYKAPVENGTDTN